MHLQVVLFGVAPAVRSREDEPVVDQPIQGRDIRRQLCALQTPFGVAKPLDLDVRATGRTPGSVVGRLTHVRHRLTLSKVTRIFVLTGIVGLFATTVALRIRPYQRLRRRYVAAAVTASEPTPAGRS